jgi:hypothetical protein
MNRRPKRSAPGVLFAAVAVVAVLFAGVSAVGSPLDRYESGDREFVEAEFGDKQVYHHQRMIGEAIVEKDYIVYHFDRDTGAFLDKRAHWREDLPDELPMTMIGRGLAESMVEGDVLSSELYYISPESDVFPLDPVPSNPCWVVRSEGDSGMVITIVDAVEARILGYGVPPPYTAFSLTGPIEFNPCNSSWASWMSNAASWFNNMGYSTESEIWPGQGKVKSHIESGRTAMFYELAHGGSDLFQAGCMGGQIPVNITATEIETWIAPYTKMPFAFIGSCGGMCETGPGSFAYEFRKGEPESTTVVGYCGMAETWCSVCWGQSIDWQNSLFSSMRSGNTVKDAFDDANADYPSCGTNDCMRFAGDVAWTVVPVVARDPWPPDATLVTPNGGEKAYYGTDYEITWVATDNVRVDSVTILLSTDGGMSFPDTIAAGEPNDSSYMWTVPDLDSKTARIRVIAIDAGWNSAADVSDGDFEIWGTTSGVTRGDGGFAPEHVALRIAPGNPISAASEIVFGIPEPMRVRLTLYDVAGRRVRTLMEGERSGGYHVVQLGTRTLSDASIQPGIYFVRLDCTAGSATTKAIIAR